jgi:hypothetical protein
LYAVIDLPSAHQCSPRVLRQFTNLKQIDLHGLMIMINDFPDGSKNRIERIGQVLTGPVKEMLILEFPCDDGSMAHSSGHDDDN